MWRTALFSILAAVPTSSNYVLQTYDFGNGAGTGASSSYNLQSSVGGTGGTVTSATYRLPAGISSSTTVGVPPAPTLTNPDNSYDRLKLVINQGSAASDTKYAVAVSDDNFVTTKYLKADQTLGSTFSAANYQSYAAWGGASGVSILNLANSVTYKAKVAALQGSSTGSAFGPTASASTTVPSVTFGVSTSATPTPPFSTTFTSLPSGTVVTANNTITTTVTSNALYGGQVLIKSLNAGLTSPTAGFTIASATANLTAAAKGYGAQITSTAQSSGGPMISASPFNSAVNNVGGLTTAWQQLASFNSAITNGSVTFGLMAKTDTLVPAAANYNDTVTLNISLLF
jgi:hypothetical protein